MNLVLPTPRYIRTYEYVYFYPNMNERVMYQQYPQWPMSQHFNAGPSHISTSDYMHAHRIARYRIYLFIWKSIYFRPWHSWTIGSWILYTQPWASHQIRKIAGYACAENAVNVFPATDLKENRYLAIQAYITARKWPLSDLSDDGHARAVMHVGIANPRWRGKRSLHSRRMRNLQFLLQLTRAPLSW